MKTVYKYPYPIPAIDNFTLPLPVGATPLHFEVQDDQLCLWAVVDPEVRSQDLFRFRMAGTGHPIKDDECAKYINTVFFKGCVFHFFQF